MSVMKTLGNVALLTRCRVNSLSHRPIAGVRHRTLATIAIALLRIRKRKRAESRDPARFVVNR
jgi:hypothetical protein